MQARGTYKWQSLFATKRTAIYFYPAPAMTLSDEKQKALRGELFRGFVPELIAERRRCSHACQRLNNAGVVSRRRLVELWRE